MGLTDTLKYDSRIYHLQKKQIHSNLAPPGTIDKKSNSILSGKG
jgi:hypothetical protein